jgi:hypothetical protein
MNFITILLLLFSVAPFSSAPVVRCVEQTPAGAFHQAKVVFVGKVIAVDDPGLPPAGARDVVFDLVRPVKVRFVLEQVYRGKKTDEIEIATRTGGLEWGYDFEVGEKYLVYAQQNETNDSEFFVEACGRTRSFSDAREDLTYLEAQKDEEKP